MFISELFPDDLGESKNRRKKEEPVKWVPVDTIQHPLGTPYSPKNKYLDNPDYNARKDTKINEVEKYSKEYWNNAKVRTNMSPEEKELWERIKGVEIAYNKLYNKPNRTTSDEISMSSMIANLNDIRYQLEKIHNGVNELTQGYPN